MYIFSHFSAQFYTVHTEHQCVNWPVLGTGRIPNYVYHTHFIFISNCEWFILRFICWFNLLKRHEMCQPIEKTWNMNSNLTIFRNINLEGFLKYINKWLLEIKIFNPSFIKWIKWMNKVIFYQHHKNHHMSQKNIVLF